MVEPIPRPMLRYNELWGTFVLIGGARLLELDGLRVRVVTSRVEDPVDEMYNRWLAWTRELKGVQDTSGVTSLRSEEVSANKTLNKADLSKCIENYAATVESNLEKAYELIMSDFRLYSLKKDINTLRRYWFKEACQGMHRCSFNGETLVDIFCELQEVSIYTVELLRNIKNATDTSQIYLDDFVNGILNPFIRNVRNSIVMFSILVPESLLKHAESIMSYILSIIIIALLLFICLGSATDMEKLMIFATVIHLIISGDVETNPGPQYNARNLYKKEPKVSDFQRLFLRSGAARYWKIFGRALDVDVNDPIYCSQSAEVMIGTVFERWRDQHKDFTWKTIIKACKGYRCFGRVRHAINKFLSSRKAHEKYGDEPDFESEESRRSKNDQPNITFQGPLITFNVVNVHVHLHVPTRH